MYINGLLRTLVNVFLGLPIVVKTYVTIYANKHDENNTAAHAKTNTELTGACPVVCVNKNDRQYSSNMRADIWVNYFSILHLQMHYNMIIR